MRSEAGDVIQEVIDVVGRDAILRNEVVLAVADLHAEICLAQTSCSLAMAYPGLTLFLGDYLDRVAGGSVPVVQTLCDLAERRPATIFCKGNHEAMFLSELAERGLPPAVACDEEGLQEYAIIEYGKMGYVPDRHLRFLTSLRTYFEMESLIFLHAGVDHPAWVDKPISSIPEQILLWSYDSNGWKGDKKLVRGHQPVSVVTETAATISLETEFRHAPPTGLSIGIVRDKRSRHQLLGHIRVDCATLAMKIHWNPLADFTRRKR